MFASLFFYVTLSFPALWSLLSLPLPSPSASFLSPLPFFCPLSFFFPHPNHFPFPALALFLALPFPLPCLFSFPSPTPFLYAPLSLSIPFYISLFLPPPNMHCLYTGSSFSGNMVCILVLTSQDIDLKPSFANILICLVSKWRHPQWRILGHPFIYHRPSSFPWVLRHPNNRSHLEFAEFLYLTEALWATRSLQKAFYSWHSLN